MLSEHWGPLGRALNVKLQLQKHILYFSKLKYFPLLQSMHRFNIQEEIHSLRVIQQHCPTPARSCRCQQVLTLHPCVITLQPAPQSRKHWKNVPWPCTATSVSVLPLVFDQLCSIPYKSQILLFILGSVKPLYLFSARSLARCFWIIFDIYILPWKIKEIPFIGPPSHSENTNLYLLRDIK